MTATTSAAHSAPQAPRFVVRDAWILRAGVALLVVWLSLTIALPLWALLSKSFQNADGRLVGLANYIRYFSTPTLFGSIYNSLGVALLSTAIVVPLAFVYAYALTRTRIAFKGLFYAAALLPLFAPSLLSAISLIYLFGNQGLFKGLLLGASIYGPIGIIIAQVFYCFPHALMIMVAALTLADARLYEVAEALGTSRS
ncbi:MAG: putative 2-aminoethylphosphonate ABC transporter permease subunit, partial [Bacteroidota bacterium]